MKMANKQLTDEIAEREEAQNELYRANREIQSLISSIPLIMIEVSSDGIIKRWNTVAERVFGIGALWKYSEWKFWNARFHGSGRR